MPTDSLTSSHPLPMNAWLDQTLGPLMGWCLLVAAAAIVGHLVFRWSGFPRMLGYTLVGLLAGWLGVGDLAWPLVGNPLLLLQAALGTSLLIAATQVSLRWLLRQPMLLVQSLAESLAALVLVTGGLQLLGMGWAVSLGVGVVAMAASPAVLLRVAADLRAAGAVTDRSLLLATLSAAYALLLCLVLTVAWQPGEGAAEQASLSLTAVGLGYLLWSLGLSVLWAVLAAAALWPVLRWQSSRSDTTALYMLAVLVAVSLLATRCGGSAVLGFVVAGLLLRNLSPKPLVWPAAFTAANTMLNLLMFVLVASMATQVAPGWGLVVAVGVATVARLVGKLGGVLLLGAGIGTGIGWRRQWAIACAQSPSSGLALALASGLVLQWGSANAGVAGTVSAIALPMVVVSEVVGVLLASLALWRSGEAHRGIGPAALAGKEKRHDA